MTWRPLLHFNYVTRTAYDETGNGCSGRVRLPAPDRFEDAPIDGIATAVRFDDNRSQIIVPTRPAFSGWRGVRVAIYFQAEQDDRRLNLVEGDGSFALFVEPGGVLRGTINDGSASWWGVSSDPGRVRIGRWHHAELIYDAGRLVALSLDGQLLRVAMTAGLPIRSVMAQGIHIGSWPGGDARFTFKGRLGPIWIDTLDELNPPIEIINKLICAEAPATSRLETAVNILKADLSSAERQKAVAFGRTVNAALKRLTAVVIGQAQNQAATLDAVTTLADDLGRLLTVHEAAGTDALDDPALAALLKELYYAMASGNPGAQSAFALEALRLVSTAPLSQERLAELRQKHPDLCASSMPPVDLRIPHEGDGDTTRVIDDLITQLCSPSRDPHRPSGSARETDRSRNAEPCTPTSTVHVHVNCGCHKGEG